MAHGLLKFTGVAVIVGGALYAGIGYWGVPYATKAFIGQFIETRLNRPVTLERVAFNPWTLTYELRGLHVPGKDRDLLSLKTLRLDAAWASVTELAPIIDEITIDGLTVNAVMNATLKAEIEALTGNSGKGGASAGRSDSDTSSGGLPDFALYNISVTNSAFHYEDPALGVQQSITDFTLQLPFVSTLAANRESLVTPALSMKLNGTTIEAVGSTKPFGSSLEAQLSLNVQKLALRPFAALVPQLSDEALSLASGDLSSELTLIFRNPTGGQGTKMLLAGNAELTDLNAVTGTGKSTRSLVKLDRARITLKGLDFVERTAAVDTVLLEGLNANLEKTKNRITGLEAFVSTNTSAPAVVVQEDHSDDNWRWSVGEVNLQNAQLSWRDTDVSPAAKVAVKKLNAAVTGLSNAGDPGRLSMSASLLGGTIQTEGTIGISPLAVHLTMTGDKLALTDAAGYIKSATGLDVTATTGFRLTANYTPDSQNASGKVTATNLAVKQGKSTWLSLPAFETDINTLDLLKRRADIDRIYLKGATVNAVMTNKGLNFTQISSIQSTDAGVAAGTADAANATGNWGWRVATVLAENAVVNLRDETLKPAAKVTVSPLNITVKNLTNEPKAKASADVAAGIAGGTLHVAGLATVSPVSADLDVETRKLQLKTLSPFLVGYTGIGAKNGIFDMTGHASLGTNGNLHWQGDMSLADLDLTNAAGAGLMSWKKATLTGIDVAGPDPFSLGITKAQIDQPAEKQTQTVRKVAGIAAAIQALRGKESSAQKIDKYADKFEGTIVLDNIRYENGRFEAKGFSSETLGRLMLDKLSAAVADKFPAPKSPTTADSTKASP